MATKIINGNDLMLFDANGRSYAYATTHTLSIEASTIEVSSHDSGLVNNQIVSGYSWTISSENLFTTTDYYTLFNYMIKGTHITVYFGFKNEEGKSVIDDHLAYYTLDRDGYYTGKVVITSLKVNSQSKENATYSIEFEGVSEFKYTHESIDYTSVLPNKGLYTIRASPTQLVGWSDGDNINILDTKAVYWRGSKTDSTVTATFTLPKAGQYRLEVSAFSTFESSLSAERLYGTFQVNGKELLSVENNSIWAGRSTTELNSNDKSFTDTDGTIYYLPNYTVSDSVKAYFDAGKYKVYTEFYGLKGAQITLKMGQTTGGSKTHVLYSNITLKLL